MKTTKILLLCAIGLNFTFGRCKSEDKAQEIEKTQFELKTPDDIDNVDYQIYSLVLIGTQTESNELIINQRSSEGSSISDYYAKYLKTEVPDLDETVITDYQAKNTHAIHFDRKFTVDSKTVRLIAEEELSYIFSVPDINRGWGNFYTKYPNSKGYTNFSRIGYNADKTEAILEVGSYYASLGAEGKLILLKKENNVWKIVRIQGTWIS